MDALTELVRVAGRALDDVVPAGPYARPDYTRAERTGIPEVILAETKADDDLVRIVEGFLDRRARAIVSRARPEQRALLQVGFPGVAYEEYGRGRTVVLRRSGGDAPPTGGDVGILAAGTSDLPIAEEAAVIVREMGCRVTTAYDVGVAGIHRLVEPLRAMTAGGLDVLIVAAGMDGALPSVVAGLVAVPVIGLPVSVGYGLGGQGVAALMSMLQTCAPGLAVVNIDNGVGAGATAGLIARRAALARGEIATLA
ncbi:MAG: nickel pincer cofactor biosynthesis protein LarB [Chloroflexi bacterium]|nr:nickel pincer cofactor biosynthesis protein LarB [Chloroflexota bacterium]